MVKTWSSRTTERQSTTPEIKNGDSNKDRLLQQSNLPQSPPPHTPIQHRKSNSPRLSYAEIVTESPSLTASLSNRKKSISGKHIALLDDHKSNASRTDQIKDVVELSFKTKNNPVEEVPLELKINKNNQT